MTRFLTWLYNQRSVLQRLIAVGLLTVVLLTISGVALFSIYYFNSQAEEIREKRELLAQLHRVVSLRPAKDSTATANTVGTNIFLEGESITHASATLHTMVESMVASNAVTLSSVASLPAQKSGDVDLVGLKIIITGTLENVHKVIFSLETATPPLLIKKLAIQSAPQRNRKTEPKMSLNLNIFGALSPENQQQVSGEQS